MRRSVMHLVYSVVVSFAMVSSPAFNVSILTSPFLFLSHSHFDISPRTSYTSHSIVAGASLGCICLVTASG